MKIGKLRSGRARRRAGIAGAAALALALGTGGTAFAQAPVNPLGNPQEILNTALTKKEGCDYPGALVPVVALLSYDAVRVRLLRVRPGPSELPARGLVVTPRSRGTRR